MVGHQQFSVYSSMRTTDPRVTAQEAGAPIQFAQEAVPCPFAETFSPLIGSLNIRLSASEENDFDHGVPRRSLPLTTSQGTPCEGSFW